MYSMYRKRCEVLSTTQLHSTLHTAQSSMYWCTDYRSIATWLTNIIILWNSFLHRNSWNTKWKRARSNCGAKRLTGSGCFIEDRNTRDVVVSTEEIEWEIKRLDHWTGFSQFVRLALAFLLYQSISLLFRTMFWTHDIHMSTTGFIFCGANQSSLQYQYWWILVMLLQIWGGGESKHGVMDITVFYMKRT